MKYFDALKRKKVYIDNGNRKEFTIEIKSEDYLKLKIEEQIGYIEEKLNKSLSSYDDLGFANKITVKVFDEGDYILDDKEIFNLMSNVATIYAKLFKKQDKYVSAPKQKFLESLPVSPFVSYMLMASYIVDKPFQFVVERSHKESGSFEEVTFI